MIMKNQTVKELIEMLEKVDQDAIVCGADFEMDTMLAYSFEICRIYNNMPYIDDSGNQKIGNILALY